VKCSRGLIGLRRRRRLHRARLNDVPQLLHVALNSSRATRAITPQSQVNLRSREPEPAPRDLPPLVPTPAAHGRSFICSGMPFGPKPPKGCGWPSVGVGSAAIASRMSGAKQASEYFVPAARTKSRPEALARGEPAFAVAFADPGEHMAEFVQRRAGDLDRRVSPNGTDLGERVVVAVLPAAEVRDTARGFRTGAVDQLRIEERLRALRRSGAAPRCSALLG
jgi:hypothetical protein